MYIMKLGSLFDSNRKSLVIEESAWWTATVIATCDETMMIFFKWIDFWIADLKKRIFSEMITLMLSIIICFLIILMSKSSKSMMSLFINMLIFKLFIKWISRRKNATTNLSSLMIFDKRMLQIAYFHVSCRLMSNSRILKYKIMIRIKMLKIWTLKNVRSINETFASMFKQTSFDDVFDEKKILILI